MKPHALKPGDTIGLVAPASAFDRRDFEAGAAALRERGFAVRHRDDIFDRVRYLAGGEERRADEIHQMFCDPEVHAIFGVRGGYGASRIIHLLDADLIRRHAKIFVGMSDLTTLLLWLERACGLVTFHGPVIAKRGGWSDFTWRHLVAVLEGRQGKTPLRPQGLRTVIGGVAEGRLLGGNLTLLSHSIGTPWQPDTRGTILFIEEVNERYFRVDRKIVHLRTAGLLEGIAGVLVGQVHKSGERKKNGYTLEEVLRDVLGDLGVPVLMGFPAGHGRHNMTIPMGVRVRMDADQRMITWLETGVISA
ncbi:MAG: hypothetical protein A2Y95_05210 [Deltaproteobacteria bacterium RBG_13_65_10]|nr:MAG: hypothetical protein A2Y95_05210 [Deltaproteobacteria bacterium RBG_13_65_10]